MVYQDWFTGVLRSSSPQRASWVHLVSLRSFSIIRKLLKNQKVKLVKTRLQWYALPWFNKVQEIRFSKEGLRYPLGQKWSLGLRRNFFHWILLKLFFSKFPNLHQEFESVFGWTIMFIKSWHNGIQETEEKLATRYGNWKHQFFNKWKWTGYRGWMMPTI